MDEKKNETALTEEEITEAEEIVEAQDVAATDEAVAEADAAEVSPEQAQEAAEVQEEPAEEPETAAESAVSASEEKPLSTQKLLIIIAASVLAVAFIVGGVVLAKNIHDTKAQYTFEDGSPTPDSPEGIKKAHDEKAEVVTGEDATKGAEVTDSDAIAVISELPDEKLGIEKAAYADKEDKEHSFMVAGQAYVIEGGKYIQVVAAEKKENKDKTINITPKAKFYISFDGKTILKEDMENLGTYEKIK